MAVTAVALMYQCAETTRIARGRGTACAERPPRARCSGCRRGRSSGCRGRGRRRACRVARMSGRSSRAAIVRSTGARVSPSRRPRIVVADRGELRAAAAGRGRRSRSSRTASTCPGAAEASLAKPSSVSVASVARPSSGHGSRRSQPRRSSRATTCDSRDSDEWHCAASWLIRSTCPSAFDRLTITMYSKWLSPASRCSWVSSAAGRRMMTPIRLSQACASMPVQPRGAPGSPGGRLVPASQRPPRIGVTRAGRSAAGEVSGSAGPRPHARRTRPAAPSTVSRAPVVIRVGGAPGTPTTAGMPYSRATTAPCEFAPPISMTSAAGGEEQRRPAGVGGRRDEDLAGLQVRADGVEDHAGRRR